MATERPESNSLITTGNAVVDGNNNSGRGWFVGHFIDAAEGLRSTKKVEVKWGIHPADHGKSLPDASKDGTTLTLLISGEFMVSFPDVGTTAHLRKSGDYVIFAPGVIHVWRAVTDSVVVTIRWPSASR